MGGEIKRVMEKDGKGVDRQIYPVTHVDAIEGIDKFGNIEPPVKSVNGKVGNVVLTPRDLGIPEDGIEDESLSSSKFKYHSIEGARIALNTVGVDNLRILGNSNKVPINFSEFEKATFIDSDGKLNTGGFYSSWCVTGFIPVKPVTQYEFSMHRLTCFYDNDQQLIGFDGRNVGVNKLSVYTPNNCYYIRTNVSAPDINYKAFENFQIIDKTNGAKLKEEIKIGKSNIEKQTVQNHHIKQNSIDEENVTFVQKNGFDSKNYFSTLNMSQGFLRNTGLVDNSTVDVRNYVVTDYILVQEGKYKINFVRNYGLFDENDVLISFVDKGSPNASSDSQRTVITIPSNVKKIRITVANLTDNYYYAGPNDIVMSRMPDSLMLAPEIRVSYSSIVDRPPISIASYWKEAEAAFLGDSIIWQGGNKYASTSEIAKGYQQHLIEALEFKRIDNYGASGKPIANGTRNGTGIVEIVKSLSYSTYHLFLLSGGTNDFRLDVPMGIIGKASDTIFDTNTFYGAYREAVEFVIKNNKDISMVLFTPIQRNNAGYDVDSSNGVGHKLIDYVNAIKKIGEMYSIPVWDGYSQSGITKLNLDVFTLDGLHPNDKGYRRATRTMIPFINNLGGN